MVQQIKENIEFEIIKIQEKITIDSQYIDSNIEKHLLTHLKKLKEHTCTKKHGFINQVYNIKIIDSEISMADSSNIFEIEYYAKIFKPVIGKKYTSKKALFSKETRILMDIDSLFQIMIINGIVENDYYVFKTCNCKININPSVIQKISNLLLKILEFKDGNYLILGEHTH